MKSRTTSTWTRSIHPLPHFSITSPYLEEPRLLLTHLLRPELSPSAGGVPDRAPTRGPPLRWTVVSGRRPPLVPHPFATSHAPVCRTLGSFHGKKMVECCYKRSPPCLSPRHATSPQIVAIAPPTAPSSRECHLHPTR
ncbi:uncharacterized protein LOC119277366 [Triticum dicoccoides]|uniref:uncharacterized protein LOC119277366 n=1 Tax=Triticum dicoccoides TaxID=85692 RepID=UPI0018909BED|nr:uncharacterized protein LOC119277366 [Triticum dicoccoides]